MRRDPARRRKPDHPGPERRHHGRAGFTLAELLVVTGLIAMLSSLLLPVLGKARGAANATKCLANLREMNHAYAMYTAANRGHLLHYVWRPPGLPDLAWHGSWQGVLEQYKVSGESLLCPDAAEPIQTGGTSGYGTADYAWNGQFGPNGSSIKLNTKVFRTGSYGFNVWFTAARGFGENGEATKLAAVKNTCEVPVFFDCVFVDAEPPTYVEADPPATPPNLRGGDVTGGSPQHWRFLIARHGKAINVGFADGSARRVRLDDTYMMQWRANWPKAHIPLPGN